MTAVILLLFFINSFWLFLISRALYKKNKIRQETPQITSDFKCKINVTRFNPFENVGGDQSFILTILDQNNSGAVVTSLHNRDITRIYAKSIKNGQVENNTLSKEEKLAIVNTIKG